MDITLIRHTTPASSPGLIYGHTDVPLADSFTTELAAVRANLPGTFDVVYSSPSRRCVQLAGQLTPAVHLDERLRELNFGEWEGQTWDSIDRQASELWMQDFVNRAPPGGESMHQMNERVMDFWLELVRQPYQHVGIVTHGGVIRLLLAADRQIPLVSAFTIDVTYGDVITLHHS
jgi:alpha-ribazole phosphatase